MSSVDSRGWLSKKPTELHFWILSHGEIKLKNWETVESYFWKLDTDRAYKGQSVRGKLQVINLTILRKWQQGLKLIAKRQD